MKKWFLILLVWLLFGIFNWTATLGYFGTKYPPAKKFYGFAFAVAITGPIGMGVVAIGSNLFQYGFKLK